MSKLAALRKVRKELTNIKKNFTYDKLADYNKIYNACVEYDNNYSDLYLCDYISDQNFETDDFVSEFLIPQNSDSLARLRCFINSTYDDNLYKIDGYGNLDNVESGDLEDLCDELLKMVNESLEELEGDTEL